MEIVRVVAAEKIRRRKKEERKKIRKQKILERAPESHSPERIILEANTIPINNME